MARSSSTIHTATVCLLHLYLFFLSQDIQVYAQMGTIQHAGFDFILQHLMNENNPPGTKLAPTPPSAQPTQPPPSSVTQAETFTATIQPPAPSDPASGSSGSSLLDFNSFMYGPAPPLPSVYDAQTTLGPTYVDLMGPAPSASASESLPPAPVDTSNSSTSTSSAASLAQFFSSSGGGPSFLDLFPPTGNSYSSSSSSSSFSSSSSHYQPPPMMPAPVTATAAPAVVQNFDPIGMYHNMLNAINPPTSSGMSIPAQTLPTMLNMPSPNTTTTTPVPSYHNAMSSNTALSNGPQFSSFLPKGWNLLPTNTYGSSHSQSWGSSMTGQGHHQLGRFNLWQQPRNPYHHNPIPTTHAPSLKSEMLSIPRFRTMVQRQAERFGDLAYYTQHGCVDPAPRSLYHCHSHSAQAICAAVGRTSGAGSGMMGQMMSMLSPNLIRTFEKCLTPKLMTQMMMGGGGGSGMNPMMMMAMTRGGGGGGRSAAAMLPMLLTMMNQNKASSVSSSHQKTSMHGPHSKHSYTDPSRANTLTSGAARIPHGAAQPHASHSTHSQSPTHLPGGAASAYGSGAGGGSQKIDCSMVKTIVMSQVLAAGEGLMNGEAMETVENIRKQFLPYSCQEITVKYTNMPYRLCCPGKVDPPSGMDLLKAQSINAA